jgi:hypothetical protein
MTLYGGVLHRTGNEENSALPEEALCVTNFLKQPFFGESGAILIVVLRRYLISENTISQRYLLSNLIPAQRNTGK